jgi:hypothetical protein
VKASRSILALALCTAACALAMACAQGPRGLLAGVPSPPPEITQACTLASKRCSHCHPIDRVIVTRGIGARRWQMYVEQMRLKPSSGISVEDAEVIFRCLQYVEESCTDCKQGPT